VGRRGGELTLKRISFAREYLIDLNATQAAIRAGYSQKTAGQIGESLLRDHMVAALIQQGMDERARRTEINADYVLYGIRETIERCMQAESVKGDDGTVSGEYTFNPSAALKGYELLGKHLKLFTDRVENTGKDGGPIEQNISVSFVPTKS